jgi:hypothetical protein
MHAQCTLNLMNFGFDKKKTNLQKFIISLHENLIINLMNLEFDIIDII